GQLTVSSELNSGSSSPVLRGVEVVGVNQTVSHKADLTEVITSVATRSSITLQGTHLGNGQGVTVSNANFVTGRKIANDLTANSSTTATNSNSRTCRNVKDTYLTANRLELQL